MKEERIRKNIEFKTVYRKGKSFSNKELVLYIYKNNKNLKSIKGNKISRIGISVSKKVGNSVVRSRVKRLINEGYRLNKQKIQIGYDFVVIARMAAKGKMFKEIEDALINLFIKAGLYKNENNID